MTRDWNADSYERMSAPIEAMGREVLSRLELRGDETVLDAGCGTGRVTEALLERLPEGRVIAVDGSRSMIGQARERLGTDRVEYLVADLAQLELPRRVDAILSTATFHWVPDHDALFTRLHAVLEPGGQLVAQCGGAGNIARTLVVAERVMGEDRFKDAFAGWEEGWNFVDPETTKARLEAAGFEEVETWLHEEFTQFGSVEELTRFLKTVVLKHHLTFLPVGKWDPFAAAVAGGLAEEGTLVVDYVRLNMLATRSGAA
jgi:trans-aconitate 2-methyltransferase